MKTVILGLLIIGSLLILSGCDSGIRPLVIGGDNSILQAPAPMNPISDIVSGPGQIISPEISPTSVQVTSVPGMTGSIGLDRGIVNAAHVSPGTMGSLQVEVKNTSNVGVPINITYMTPTTTRPGYTYIGDQAKDWITISPSTIIVEAYTSGYTIVKISIPETAILPPGKYEFWLAYSYDTGGFINYSLNQRWLLTTE